MTHPEDGPELSVVLPCLDEAETLSICITKAQAAFEAVGIHGVVIVADNGSKDGSKEIAKQLGAKVVDVDARGYGHALRTGIDAANSPYVLMADADDSYDLSDISRFLDKLREGYSLVMGNRMKGGILPGAMPWKHRWIGNPVLSGIGRIFFRSPVGDFHCGMRAFSKTAYEQLDLRTGGMEFASEMVIKATLAGQRIAEVPIVLHPDGRSRPPHLRSWRDGWRHLRFMLLFSPAWLFMLPGIILVAAGLTTMLALMGGSKPVGGIWLDIHTMLVSSFAALVGYQLIIFAAFTKIFAVTEGLHPASPVLDKCLGYVRLEIGLLVGGMLTLAGAFGLLVAILDWRAGAFGPLDPRITMRQLIPATALMIFGVQTIFASFFLSILGLRRR